MSKLDHRSKIPNHTSQKINQRENFRICYSQECTTLIGLYYDFQLL